jgi:hypothetical protein
LPKIVPGYQSVSAAIWAPIFAMAEARIGWRDTFR